jgi:RimJ/RimL family protein N-acetyltransferase
MSATLKARLRGILAGVPSKSRSAGIATLTLRLAKLSDERCILDWQSAESTRRYMRNPASPSRAEHAAWLRRTLKDREKTLLIVERDGRPVGSIRLDRVVAKGREAGYEISIVVAPGYRGEGIGGGSLVLLRRLVPDETFFAHVLAGNVPSARIFAGCGFVPYESGTSESILVSRAKS